ncbi:MAG TPA: hypothetical protein VIJ65_05450 [Acidobacteriaceae bacterium]
MKLSILQQPTLLACLLIGFCVAPLTLSAQDDGTNGVNGPPNILVIQREFTKPGKGGAMHERSEAAYIHALEEGKGQPHYLALTSLTGPDRALFFSGYTSLTAWEQEEKSVARNAALSSSLDHAMVADGDLLSQTDSSVWQMQKEMSLRTGNLVGARYMRISEYRIKPGHSHEWDELVKMVLGGLSKSVPEANFAMFREVYGAGGNAYIVVTPLKSMTEEDSRIGPDTRYRDAMGDEGMKKLASLESSCIESEQTNLFSISPKMSRPPESWIKAEPDYWKPKAAAPAHRTATKPTPAAAQ